METRCPRCGASVRENAHPCSCGTRVHVQKSGDAVSIIQIIPSANPRYVVKDGEVRRG